MIKVDIEELVRLNKQGMTDKRIAEYLTECGIKISQATVNLKLKEYYKSIGEEKPKWGEPITDQELAELKEKDMSDAEISEHFKKQGLKISSATVGHRLKRYYEARGQIKPRASVTRNGPTSSTQKHIEEAGETIVTLRKQGKSLREIEKSLKELGKNMDYETIRKILILMGEVEEKIEISNEELLELEEQGMSGREIAEYLTKQGKTISITSVNNRLKKHYEPIGKERTKKISDEEMIELKEKRMTDFEIAEYLTKTGREMSVMGVSKRLRKCYKAMGKKKPKVLEKRRKKQTQQLQTESNNPREDFAKKLKVSTPVEPIEQKNEGSENVINYTKSDEER